MITCAMPLMLSKPSNSHPISAKASWWEVMSRATPDPSTNGGPHSLTKLRCEGAGLPLRVNAGYRRATAHKVHLRLHVGWQAQQPGLILASPCGKVSVPGSQYGPLSLCVLQQAMT